MRRQKFFSLPGERTVKLRYAREDVSPETYYDHMHDHPFYEICIPLSGSMIHIAGGRTYHLSLGDIYFCRPGELHYALAAEPSVYERFAFWIPADAYSWTCGGGDDALGFLADARLDGKNVVRVAPACLTELGHRLDAVRDAIMSDGDGAPLAAFCRLTELLIFVRSAAAPPDGESDGIGSEHSPDIIHKVIRYVRDNYRTIDGISEIADHFYINKDYLTRVFRRFTGFTVHDYIRSVRISKSRMMLGGGAGVTETAFACGFNSTSYFIRVFTCAVGVTPAEFRRAGRKDTINE